VPVFTGRLGIVPPCPWRASARWDEPGPPGLESTPCAPASGSPPRGSPRRKPRGIRVALGNRGILSAYASGFLIVELGRLRVPHTQEPAYLTSVGMDAGAQTDPSERKPRMGAANVRRWGIGNPKPARPRRRGEVSGVKPLRFPAATSHRLILRRPPLALPTVASPGRTGLRQDRSVCILPGLT
jgi:hypothetical protein